MESQTRKGFMCQVDFVHELGEASGGNTIYPTEDQAKKYSPCVTECGLVEVEVKVVREVLPENDRGDRRGVDPWDEKAQEKVWFENLKLKIQQTEDRLEYLKKSLKGLKEKIDNGG